MKQTTWKQRIGYGLSDTASNLTFQMVNTFLLIFYVNVMGLNPIAVGTLFLVARIWDAINDPIMGAIVDKTNSKWGKARPYFLWMAIPYGIIAVLLFTVPNLTEAGKLIWAYVTYIGFGMVYTSINIPVTAILPRLTDDNQERQEVTSVRMAFAVLGMLASSSLAPMLIQKIGGDSQAKGYQYTMIIFAVVAVTFFLIAFSTIKENVKPINEKPLPVREGFKALKGNWPWLITLLLNLFMWIGMIMKQQTTMFFLENNLGRPDLAASLLPIGGLLMLPVIIVAPLFTKRMGKRNTLILGNIITVFGYLIVIINPASIPMVYASAIVAALGGGFSAAIIFALMADTVEYGEWKSGVRAEGLLAAASSFGVKFGMGVGGAIGSYVLAWTGYTVKLAEAGNLPQSALSGILFNYAWAPLLAAVISIILLIFYKLDKQYPQIMIELKEKRAAQAS